jgi:predicted permease
MVPLNSQSGGLNGRVLIDGRHTDPGEPTPRVNYELASRDYFHLLGIPFIAGRSFTEDDNREAPRVAIVNERFAAHYWPHDAAIGHHLSDDNGKTWAIVVGVVSNFHQYGLDKGVEDEVYFPQEQSLFMDDAHLLIRTRNNPAWVTRQIIAVIHEIDSQQPITDVRSLDQLRNTQLGTPRVTAMLLGLFAAVALFITVVGIGGTVALSVAQRTKEIGVRMALGATRGQLMGNILLRGMVPVLVGIATGVVVATASTGLLASMLFGIERNDRLTYTLIAVLLGVSALIGCAIPARRAIRIDPVDALRSE